MIDAEDVDVGNLCHECSVALLEYPSVLATIQMASQDPSIVNLHPRFVVAEAEHD